MLQQFGVNEGLAVFNIAEDQKVATLRVLYHQDPEAGAPFIEIREWVTVGEDGYDLIAEWGRVDDDDELVTACHVLPGFWGLAQALTYVNEQLAHWPA